MRRSQQLRLPLLPLAVSVGSLRGAQPLLRAFAVCCVTRARLSRVRRVHDAAEGGV
jgi:hypothetical protein